MSEASTPRGDALDKAGAAAPRAERPLSVLAFGAHPDDCDLRFGGAAMLYRAHGCEVRFVSLTNGDTGHFSQGGGPLARRRCAEAQASAAIADIRYDVIDRLRGPHGPPVLLSVAPCQRFATGLRDVAAAPVETA